MTLSPSLIDAPPLSRFGYAELVAGAQPTAGADFVQAIDARYQIRLLSVFCRLVTSADVATRNVVVEYRDGEDNRFLVNGAPVEVLASTTIDFSFSAWQQRAEWPVDGTVVVPLSPLLLDGSYDFRIHVENMAAADQLSRIRVCWEKFSSDSPTPGALEA